ncbi:MAG: hypothetical protein J6Y40_08600 [Bacteroidales bacterium]|nr:hypothetical protein [Bacteroidales bacterium]
MKKIFLTLASIVLFAVVCFAQNEHFKFLGIPLDGTINQFESKLISKGYTKADNYGSKEYRVYDGTFIGKKATIVIYYDVNTKIVHAGKAYFSDLTESKAKERLNELKELLLQKYPNALNQDYIIEGLPKFELASDNGYISVYITKGEYGYPYNYSTHIQYQDMANSESHDESIMNDL